MCNSRGTRFSGLLYSRFVRRENVDRKLQIDAFRCIVVPFCRRKHESCRFGPDSGIVNGVPLSAARLTREIANGRVDRRIAILDDDYGTFGRLIGRLAHRGGLISHNGLTGYVDRSSRYVCSVDI